MVYKSNLIGQRKAPQPLYNISFEFPPKSSFINKNLWHSEELPAKGVLRIHSRRPVFGQEDLHFKVPMNRKLQISICEKEHSKATSLVVCQVARPIANI